MGRTLRTNGTLPRQPWGPHGCRGTAAGGDWIPLGPSLAGLPGACQTVDCAGVADDHASSRPRSGDCCRNGNDRPSHRPRVLPQRQRSPVAPPASVAGTATIARAGAPTPGPGPGPGLARSGDCCRNGNDRPTPARDCCRNGNDRPSHRRRLLPQRQRSPVAPPATVAATATIARRTARDCCRNGNDRPCWRSDARSWARPGPGPATVAATATIARRPPATVAATATIARAGAPTPGPGPGPGLAPVRRLLPQRQRSPVAPPASVAATATIARAGAPTPGPGPATVAVTATITRRPPASVAATATIAQPSAGSPPPPRRPRTRRRRRLVMPPADRRRPGGHARQTGCRAGCAVPRGDALQAASVEPPPACARSKPP